MKEKPKDERESEQLDFLNGKINEIVNRNPADLMKKGPQIEEEKREKFSENEELPKNILILDTETTGFDREKDRCIEVGSILFNVVNRAVLAQQSFLLPVEKNDAEKINNIPAEITRLPQPIEPAIEYFESLVLFSDLIIAHNVEFDKKWFGTDKLPLINKKWIFFLMQPEYLS